MTSKNSEKGQSLIESLVVLPFAVSLIGALTLGSSFYFSQYLMDHWIYETLFCVQQEKRQNLCQTDLERKLDWIPFFQWSKPHIQVQFQDILISLPYSHPLTGPSEKTLRLPKHLRAQDFESRL